MADNMRWDLSALYDSFKSDKFAKDKEQIEKMILEENTWADNNLESTEDAKEKLEHLIGVMQRLYDLMTRLSAYTQLVLSTEATNEEALGMMFRLEKIDVGLDEFAKKITRFVGMVEDLDALITKSKLLSEHDFILHEMQKEASHLLGTEVEPVISKLVITGSNAWGNMRNMIDGTMEVDIEQDGEMKSLPLPIVRNMAYSPDAEVRKKAYEAELASYKKGRDTAITRIERYKRRRKYNLRTARLSSRFCTKLWKSRAWIRKRWMQCFRQWKIFFPISVVILKAKAKLLGYEGRTAVL